MSDFWKVCSFLCTQYLVGPPFAWITASMQRGMEAMHIEVFYFTCNESKIYESFIFWNKSQEKKKTFFYNIHIFCDVPVCNTYLQKCTNFSVKRFIKTFRSHLLMHFRVRVKTALPTYTYAFEIRQKAKGKQSKTLTHNNTHKFKCS